MGFGDESTNELEEPFLKIFREVRRGCGDDDDACVCAGDGCGDIEKDLCCVLSEDVVTTKEMWVELFDLAVRALHR